MKYGPSSPTPDLLATLLERLRATDQGQKVPVGRRIYSSTFRTYAKRYFLNRPAKLADALEAISFNPVAVSAFASDPAAFAQSGEIDPSGNWESAASLLWSEPKKSRVQNEKMSLVTALCAPLLDVLEHELSSIAGTDHKAVASSFFRQLSKVIAGLLMRAVVHEANIQRISRRNLGESAQKGYQVFIRNLQNPPIRQAFWQKYPVLLRLVSSICRNRVDAASEIFHRIDEDRRRLERFFGIAVDSRLLLIDWGRGDPHHKGRTVCILHFEEKPIVYKPRDLKIDTVYNGFLRWYNSVCHNHSLKCIAVLQRPEYGYVEFVNHRTSENEEDIKKYYCSLGHLLAISWVFGITDLHHENLIADRATPFLTDVETAFDRVPISLSSLPRTISALESVFADLLLKTGLLPIRQLGPNGVYDLSALGAINDQNSPRVTFRIENQGRNDMQLVEAPFEIPLQKNSPLNTKDPSKLVEHLPEIVEGFQSACQVIHKHADTIQESLRVQIESKTTLRWVPRATMYYADIIEGITHPSIATSCIEADLFILGKLRADIDATPHLGALTGAEAAALWQGDIPLFETDSNSDYLELPDRTRVAQYFGASGLDEMKTRISKLSDVQDLQADAIKKTVKSVIPLTNNNIIGPNKNDNKAKLRLSPDRVFSALKAIADTILNQIYVVDEMPFSVGLFPLEEEHYGAGILPPDLYDGLPGIGLFFHFFSRYTEDQRCRRMAERISNLVDLLISERTSPPSSGAFSGLSGLLYAKLLTSQGRSNFGLANDCEPILKRLTRIVVKDQFYDIVSGAAGALLVALRCYDATKLDIALDVAAAAALRLEEAAERQTIGVAWHTLKPHDRRLGGMAHGVSGIAWALSEYYERTDDKKWRVLARAAFEYEEYLYDDNHGTWMDLRRGVPTCFWCYGAPGVGLAVDCMRGSLSSATCDQVVREATQITWDHGFLANHCLCHGNLGNLELYRVSGEHEKASAVIHRVLRSFETSKRWMCGLPADATTPGLMCGLAGIGMGLLRHLYPAEIPNVLTLEI